MAGIESVILPDHRKSQLNEQKVRQAVTALLAHNKKGNQKNELFLNEATSVHILLAVWKITGEKSRTIKIKLPHPLRTETTEACLFTKDIKDKSNDEVAEHFNDLLKEKNVSGVGEVIPIKSLKREYKPFLARRRLAAKHDMFLADERIFRLLRVHLGKEFYSRKKYPICVDLTKKDLKTEIESAINAEYFILSNRGDCNHFKVGHTDMKVKQLVDNIMTGVQSMTEHITKGWCNVKALHIKTDKSIALPIHTSLVYQDWAADKLEVDNADITRLKKQLQAEKPESDKEDGSEPEDKTDTKVAAKRRMSGKALKKMRKKMKTEDGNATKPKSSTTAPSVVEKTKPVKAAKVEKSKTTAKANFSVKSPRPVRAGKAARASAKDGKVQKTGKKSQKENAPAAKKRKSVK